MPYASLKALERKRHRWAYRVQSLRLIYASRMSTDLRTIAAGLLSDFAGSAEPTLRCNIARTYAVVADQLRVVLGIPAPGRLPAKEYQHASRTLDVTTAKSLVTLSPEDQAELERLLKEDATPQPVVVEPAAPKP